MDDNKKGVLEIINDNSHEEQSDISITMNNILSTKVQRKSFFSGLT